MKISQVIILFVLFSQMLIAGPREDAKFLVDRILGTQLPEQEFESIVSLIQTSGVKAAAAQLTNHKDFYNIQLKNHFATRTNEESSRLVDLNDYTATLIGMVRDDVPYNQVLSGDILYVGSPSTGAPAYSHTDNNHYKDLEEKKIDLSNPSNLIRVKQSEIPNSRVPASATAGIITTRQAARAFFSAGTNRAMFRFLMMNYMCRDMEALHDASIPGDRVRQDISRSVNYTSECLGCHAGMDGLSGAFAHYDYDLDEERITYDASKAQDKFLINGNVFPKGYKTSDDSWVNYWRVGTNSGLGWSQQTIPGVQTNPKFQYTYGNGAKSMGAEIANSRAFSACAVKQVFEVVCNKKEKNLTSQDKVKVEEIASTFEASNYNYKEIWAESAAYCLAN